MIPSLLFSLAAASPIFRRDDNCQVLSTLFLQCSNGPSQAPDIYPPHCDLSADGATKCCAVTHEGDVTDQCISTDAWTGDWVGCVTMSDTLQTVCRNQDRSFNMWSPRCVGVSDGTHKCCALNRDGSETDQCLN